LSHTLDFVIRVMMMTLAQRSVV